ncbi:E3 ubiquitin-protein ligase listerin-like [Xiphias gladius]|uniref:E3 ubiquitin-protein ligase listerin-like n=1 Tax=Xiphias gladius TaxID=8245 RepID=UPI001A9A2A9F|nr:E3 ubiquitin-protein ligase listerin-like [Xiphias gladius]
MLTSSLKTLKLCKVLEVQQTQDITGLLVICDSTKGFLPKLWHLLKEAGEGMAKALCHNLELVLSKLPRQVLYLTLDFYTNFFTSMCAAGSPSKNAAMVTFAVERLSYCGEEFS